jgi:hypothetical protein
LTRVEPERVLYLAIDEEVYSNLFQDISGEVLLEDYKIKLLVVNKEQQEVIQWIK